MWCGHSGEGLALLWHSDLLITLWLFLWLWSIINSVWELWNHQTAANRPALTVHFDFSTWAPDNSAPEGFLDEPRWRLNVVRSIKLLKWRYSPKREVKTSCRTLNVKVRMGQKCAAGWTATLDWLKFQIDTRQTNYLESQHDVIFFASPKSYFYFMSPSTGRGTKRVRSFILKIV